MNETKLNVWEYANWVTLFLTYFTVTLHCIHRAYVRKCYFMLIQCRSISIKKYGKNVEPNHLLCTMSTLRMCFSRLANISLDGHTNVLKMSQNIVSNPHLTNDKRYTFLSLKCLISYFVIFGQKSGSCILHPFLNIYLKVNVNYVYAGLWLAT